MTKTIHDKITNVTATELYAFGEALSCIKSEMQENGKKNEYDIWFGNIVLGQVTEKYAVVLCSDTYARNWFIEKGYSRILTSALAKSELGNLDVKFHVINTNDVDQINSAATDQRLVFKKMKRVLARLAGNPHQPKLPFPCPTELCRTTFFRPVFQGDLPGTLAELTDNKKKKKEIIRDYYVEERHETSWAKLDYLGLQCGVVEESVLLTLLWQWVERGYRNYSATNNEILEWKGHAKSASKDNPSPRYTQRHTNMIKEAMLRLSSVTFYYYQPGEDTGDDMVQRFSIFNDFAYDGGSCYDICFSEYFLKKLQFGIVTGVDPRHRALLGRSANAIAVHRFLSTHRRNGHHTWKQVCASQRLDNVLTLPRNDRNKTYTRIIKKLVDIGYLAPKSYTDKNGVLHWSKKTGDFSGDKLVKVILKQFKKKVKQS